MKKSKKKIIGMMSAVMVMSAMSAFAVPTFAQEGTPISYVQTMDEMFNKSYDAAAPNVNKTAFENGVRNQKEVDMYNIKEGKYYVLRIHRTKVNSFGYTRTNYEHHLVKVERAFEDPTWYGSERTIDVRYCDSGETQRICPGKFFAINYPIFEMDRYVCK